ncbi:MAG: membrane protein insertion efficiency factor YidD [Streptosporangiales bacterium]
MTDDRAARPLGPVARLLVALVRGYQRFISPFFGPRCRFYPSCSAYALDAFRMHGALRGSLLTIWRVLRCQPFHPGGVDEVPAVWPRPRTARGHRRVARHEERLSGL